MLLLLSVLLRVPTRLSYIKLESCIFTASDFIVIGNKSKRKLDSLLGRLACEMQHVGRECAANASVLKCKIGPSILNADLSNLYAESQKLLDNGADYLHLDVMDGNFVPNLTFGYPVVKCLRNNIPDAFFETHMMVAEPERWIEAMADAKVNQYTFHIEPVLQNVLPICRKIKEAGMKVGLALKPGTGIEDIRQYIEHADMILIMTVEPGFGGQSFMSDMMPKVQWLRHNYPLLNIEVDGGVGLNTINACAEAGANMIVSGTAIINSIDQKAVIASLRETVESSIHKCNV